MNGEKKNRMISGYTTIGVHALLFFVFFIALAWTAPDPPIPEFGIELGLSELVTDQSSSEDSRLTEEIDAIEEQVEPVEQTVDDEAVSKPEVKDELPVEEDVLPVTEDINSPDVIEEKIVEKPSETKVEEVIKAEDVVKEKKKPEPVKPEPTIDDRALYKKNEGEGKPEKKGASLDMNGWMWDFEPNPQDKSTEIGKIVFQITVDDEGEIINVRTIEKTVSPIVEKVYRDAVMDLTFSPTAGSRSSSPQSSGKITFIIQSK